ncbi:hypothetical protein [Pseudomarimonas salicorniae]|uniref:Entericidin A n=1 Tax=Pseudomarimonas salicorniae TaxID=2933270 RepID=A0ABT0GET5_9GAMM|nr:hypothetical protein [Lysobacter sp. CAU 1642]MCK7593061.1 hypothetical protein [Lysobacter sp. CAU 1642]
MNLSIGRVAVLLLIILLAVMLSACNTLRGVGRDTAVVGEKIEKEADRHIDDENDQPR